MRPRRTLWIAASAAFGTFLLIGSAVWAASYTGSQDSPQKLADFRAQTAVAIAAASHPHGPKNSHGGSSSCPITLPTPRIFPFQNSPINRDYFINNGAILVSTGKVPYTVWAGARSDNPNQGAILLEQASLDPCADIDTGKTYPVLAYLTPRQEGALTITRIMGDTVWLESSSGTSIIFNFVTDQYQ